MYRNPTLYITGFLLGTLGFSVLDNFPRGKYGQTLRFLISVLLTLILLGITVSWACIMKWYWHETGAILFQDSLDKAHPLLVLALGVFSLCVCTMTFYWETRDFPDNKWPLSRVLFRAVTIMIPSFIFSNGL